VTKAFLRKNAFDPKKGRFLRTKGKRKRGTKADPGKRIIPEMPGKKEVSRRWPLFPRE